MFMLIPIRICVSGIFILLHALPLAAQSTTDRQLEVTARRALPAEETKPTIDTASLPRVLPEGRKSVYSRCETAQAVIAITYDDGPDPVLTPRLLDLLKARGIHATFFLVGQNAAAHPAIVQRIVAEGHEVGNHSWSHPLLTSLGEKGVESQLRRTHDAIVAACGVAPLLYRPPYGAVRVSQRTKIEKTFGYPAILWDVDPQDWQKPRTAQKVYDRVMTQTKAGSIILCHDIHEPTVAAMPAVLDDLKGRGYTFATVTQLIALTTPPPAPAPIAADKETKPADMPSPAPVPASVAADKGTKPADTPSPAAAAPAAPASEPKAAAQAGTKPADSPK